MTRTNEVGKTRAMGNAVPSTDAQPVYPHTMRLQRFLARAGVASRGGSEDLMTAGRVTVNGLVATGLGTKVDVDRDHIEVDGMPVKLNQGAVYLMLYKPTGYLTTMSDPQERPCVADLVPRDRFPGLFPVGRLDRDTTGLLLFTTDGDLSQDLLHPSKHVYKTYQALVDGQLTDRRSHAASSRHRARRWPVPAGDLPRHRRARGRSRGTTGRQARHHGRGGHHPRGPQEPGQAHAEQNPPPGDPPASLQLCRPGARGRGQGLVARAHPDREVQILKDGGIPPKQASTKRGGKPQDTPASRTRHHGSHGSAPKRNTYRERYTG